MIWHDPEGSAADHDILPPELDGIADGLYSDWRWHVVPIELALS